ncbi:MAG TPA: hypothetical protein VIC02_08950 [Kineobactrum sp.]
MCALVGWALAQLLARGYGPIALALLLPAIVLLWCCRSRAWLRGLVWHRGHWRLWDPVTNVLCMVQLLPGSVRLPWLICIRVREESGGRRHTLWFWPGCSSPESLQALRRRLTLEG